MKSISLQINGDVDTSLLVEVHSMVHVDYVERETIS